MSDEQLSEAVSYPTADNSPMSVEDAARSLTDARHKAQASPAESAPEATAEPELAVEADAGPEEVPGETQDADPAEQLPSVEPPRSWTKEARERWSTIPREAQEEFARIEQGREREFLRSQQEAAEKLKGLTAKEEQAEKVRQQYEAQLPALLKSLQDSQQADFSDIRTVEDVERLANEAARVSESDPFLSLQLQGRYAKWQAHQMKLQAVHAENERARNEKSKAEQTEWASHVQKENALAAELIPDLTDKVKGPALTQRAANRLSELGFKPEELNDLASGKQKLSIYDHRFQQLIFSDLKLSDIQNATKAIAAKPVPAVQRPGQAKPANSGSVAQIQALEKQLSSASGDKAARISAEIWRLEKKTASR